MRAYAQHRGVSVNAVSLAVKEGRITLGKDRKIDVARADRQWEANTNKRGGSDAAVAAKGLPTYAESRAAREAYAALREKQEYEITAGKLLPRDAVVQMLQAVVGTARAKLLGLPAAMAPLVAAESRPRVCEEILTKGVREVLEELCDRRNYRVGDRDLGATA